MSTIINATTTNGVVIQPDNSGSLVLQTNNGTTALTIDTSQKVGIGTTSIQGKFNVGSGRSFFGANSETYSIGVGYTQARVSSGQTFYIGATDSATPDLVFSNAAGTERMRIDSSGNLLFNSGYGSVATAYGCRAWVNFNGTGTVAIRSSGNVSSITDNGTGDYTVNFTNSMPDTSYSVGLSVREDTSGFSGLGAWNQIFRSSAAISTTSTRVIFANGSTKYDVDTYCVQIFR